MRFINDTELYEIIESRHKNPHHMLGMHKIKSEVGKDIIVVRVFMPCAKKVELINLRKPDEMYELEKMDNHGFFQIIFDDKKRKFKYKLKYEDYYGNTWENHDPYSFDRVITDYDIFLFNAGRHYNIYKKLGAHTIKLDDVEGVLFGVWAPNANRVSVIGGFNGWDGRIHQMRMLNESGIWEIFVPNIGINEVYKFEIKTMENKIIRKSDPYANHAELRPKTASIVTNIDEFEWDDEEWLEDRKNLPVYSRPMNIYEVHLGSWKRVQNEGNRWLTYREIAHELCDYVKYMGYSHIELLPVEEHPLDASWGYQVTGYFAPTSRYGTPEDFAYFINYMHKNNIGVILDWVPAHFPKDDYGLRKFDGTSLYEHEDPRQGEHPDWGTLIFNYGRNEVKNFLISNAIFWINEFHLDGLRVDAVASMLYLDYGKNYGEWVPNYHGGKENIEAIEFMKHMNSIIENKYPGVLMIAEESTAWGGVSRSTKHDGLGFKYKWNMGWMNDFLRYISKEPIYKKYHHNDLTFSLVYAYTENFILVLSHDEVVHEKCSMIGKMPGDYWQKFANLRAAYGFMYAHPGKKLLFQGSDFGQFSEWSEERSLDWHLCEYEKHKKMQDFMKYLNHLYLDEKCLWEEDFNESGFEWIDPADYKRSIISFVRKSTSDKNDFIICVCNFTPIPDMKYRLGVPKAGTYIEVLNSDDKKFGGSHTVNDKPINSDKMHWNHRENSIEIKLPPLGVTYLKYKSK